MNRLSCFSIAALLALDAFLVYKYVTVVRADAENSAVLLQELSEQTPILTNFTFMLDNAGFRLADIPVVCEERNVPLLSLFPDSSEWLFVYRFSEHHCESCIEYGLDLLKSQTDSSDANVLLLGEYTNNRIFKRLIGELGVGGYHVGNSGRLDLPAEEYSYPYYLVLNKDGIVSCVYVPSKDQYVTDSTNLRRILGRYLCPQISE